MNNLYIFLIVCGGVLFLVRSDEAPYCFQFTWVAPVFDSKPDRYNCSLFKGVPCIEPLFRTGKPPNTTDLWKNRDNSTLCSVTSGNVCIKYTFTYNNQIVNTSLFCGKAIEDKVDPITSGCYEQSVNNSVVVNKQGELLYNFFDMSDLRKKESQSNCLTRQKVDGYTIEMCACQPKRGREPCNLSTDIEYSIILIIGMLSFAFTGSV